MKRKDVIIMSQKEIRRVTIINKVLEKRIRQVEAGKILSLSDRQIRRIVLRVKKEGEKGIIHKSRGKESNRKISGKIKSKVIKLYREKYNDFGPTFASEKLLEQDKIKVNDETLRLWLVETGDWEKRRKNREHRRWRERKQYYGEMVQIDGSHHKWFEERGPECVLMGYIDDATGKGYGRFYEYEGTIPALDSFKRYCKKHGIPLSVYLDKHPTYKSTMKEENRNIFNPMSAMSEFERVAYELGVKVIHANSPQAKGRVERLFQTLQDRLIKEMRLKGIKTIEDGNKFLEWYLPVHNKRFSVQAMQKQDIHVKILPDTDLDSIFCIKTERTLRNDFTISYNNQLYQIEDATKAKKVIVEKRINGQIFITYNKERLRYKKIELRTQLKESGGIKLRKGYKPSKDHPWKKSYKKDMMTLPQRFSTGIPIPTL